MAPKMLERESERPRARRVELPQVRREQTEYHPIEALARCAESMKTNPESTYATPHEAAQSWEVSARVSEIAPDSGTPLHQRFRRLVEAVE